MRLPPTAKDESTRLEILRIVEQNLAEEDSIFDFIVKTVATNLALPITSLTLVDSDKQWVKRIIGLETPQWVPREVGFCTWTIEQDDLLMVEDTLADDRFSDHPLVVAEPYIRSYTGAPLVVREQRIGALCVMHTLPRALTGHEKQFLIAMADVCSRLLEEHITRSERDRAVEVAAENEHRLRFALEAAGFGDWELDLQTRVARRSLAHDRCFGYVDAVEHWEYNTFLEHVHFEDRSRVNDHFLDAMAKLGAYDVKFKCLWADGSIHWLWSKGRFYADSHGTAHRVAGIVADVTQEIELNFQRATLEAQLRESQKSEELGRLAGGIAHDFNNIIGVVLGNAKLALDEREANESVTLCLHEIEKAGSRAKDLVQQILAFSRRQPTNVVLVQPAVQLDETARLLRPLIPANISIFIDAEKDIPEIDFDKVQLDQIVMNLITNAAYAMGAKPGEIRIEIRSLVDTCLNIHPNDSARRRCVVISVIDNGAGMDIETQRQIFNPFFTTKPIGEGTGLGLAVVHGIVARHGGKITVSSTLGVGTRFDLYFPASDSSSKPLESNSAVRAPSPGEFTGRVLYIDDDEALVFLVTRLLERNGHEVSAFTSSVEALDFLRSTDRNFDVVVSDYNMPGENGVDVLQQVRMLRPSASFALMSGFITDAMRKDAAHAGILEIIFKADSAIELSASVSRMLASSTGNI